MFMGIANHAFSQFNDSVNYYLKYAATGTYNKTNDGRSYIFNNGVSFTMNKKKATLNSSNSWIYGKSNSNLTNNDFSSALNFDLLKNMQRLYYWGLGTYTTSYSLKINHQFQGGIGIGYNIFNRKDLELVVSNGVLYETNNLELAPQVRDKYNTFRNSLRIKFHLTIKDLIVLDTWDYWQPSLANFDDYIIRSSSTLTLKLRKWLGITTSLNYNRLSRTNRENLLLNFGLTAETYF
ncbi:MAG: hypothetical protein DI535_09580 [Citrobacter freundii]|nr:MAG: hypothetical protein DI535_09580 [Citrobacter freundii]